MKKSLKKSRRMCASWCGRGCTKAEHDRALRLATACARKLGKGWRPRVHENLGWYGYTVSSCGRITVRVSSPRRNVQRFLAQLGDGRWSSSGLNPGAAVDAVVSQARSEVSRLRELVENLPTWR